MTATTEDLLRSILLAGGAVAVLDSKFGKLVRADANSTAETERRWIIRGVYPDGKKLQFNVNAFDHSDAKKKAEAKKGGGKITDIVLNDSMKPDADPKGPTKPYAEMVPKKYQPAYNAEAVQKEINKDKRIKPGEAKAIHDLLKGWRGDEAKTDVSDKSKLKAEMDRYHSLSKEAKTSAEREKYEDLAEKFRQKWLKA